MELQIVVEPEATSMEKGCCIYNVPKKLRQLNEEAYTPQVVSIGPLHHDKPHLQAMQLTKKRFCKRFCKRTQSNMDRYIKEAKGWEADVRACYEGVVEMKSDEFVKMILVDGIFVVEVLLWISKVPQYELGEVDEDEIFRNNLLKDDVIHDMMMVENQLPLFVIENLYNFVNINAEWKEVLFNFAEKYFKKSSSLIQTDWVSQALSKGRHLIEFYHIISVCANPSVDASGPVVLKYDRYNNSTDHGKKFELPIRAEKQQQSGVDFKPKPYLLPFDLNFNLNEGIMEIPVVTINRWTEAFFTNMIAFEHCLRKEKIITSFVVFMAKLLEKPSDVQVLIDCKVIHDETLGDIEDVCDLFRRLYKKSMMNKTEFFYADLCKDLNKYSRDNWHKCNAKWCEWKEILHEKYFSSPWAAIAVIAAFILFSFDALQTYYAANDANDAKKSSKH